MLPSIIPSRVLYQINRFSLVKFFFVGIIYYSVSLFFALWLFPSNPGPVSLVLAIIFALPFFYSGIYHEELVDETNISEGIIIKSHFKLMTHFLAFFFGIVVIVVLWNVLLPAGVTDNVFSEQLLTIEGINPGLAGQAYSNVNSVTDIFLHNLKILVLCLAFSFLYGLGAVYILVWNATIIGTAIANFIKANLGPTVSTSGVISTGFFMFFIHGVPEILSFFIAALAGGVISVAMIRSHLFTKKAQPLIFDVVALMAMSVILLFIAAILEVYVSHVLF